MNELMETNTNLPETIEDLTRFALIGREKLAAVRAEIRAIDKLKLADDVRAQKKIEAQSIAEAVMDAEVRVGELLRAVPKATPNNNPFHEKRSVAPLVTPKQQARESVGISPDQAKRFVKLAENKEIVEQAKAEARENDDIVSRSFALEKIKAAEREERERSRETERVQNAEKVATLSNPLEAMGAYQTIVVDPRGTCRYQGCICRVRQSVDHSSKSKSAPRFTVTRPLCASLIPN